jgi:lipid-A-disaccharide synthase
MQETNRPYRIFMSAAEPSADAHCAGLIRALQKTGRGKIEFVGVGGPEMAKAGCKLLEGTVAKAVMIYKAFRQIGRYYMVIRRIAAYLKATDVDLVVVCDSPSFNFHVAKAAKKAGIKTLFYVAPQLWAWGAWRIGKLRKYCDKLCCILPFERQWFGSRGLDAVFVGNPLFDELKIHAARPKTYDGFEPKESRFALMPGSRSAEIESLWRPMQQISLRIREKYPGTTFVAVAVDAERKKMLMDSQILGFECRYAIGSVNQTVAASDFALVASGSATLQVAAAGCPMVIMYQSSKVLWHLAGRFLVRSKYLSLVNILAGRELVPEFMPYFSSIEPVVEAVMEQLESRDVLERISDELIELIRPLAQKKAGEEVAGIVAGMLD